MSFLENCEIIKICIDDCRLWMKEEDIMIIIKYMCINTTIHPGLVHNTTINQF